MQRTPSDYKNQCATPFFGMDSPRNRGWYQARVRPFSSGNGKENGKATSSPYNSGDKEKSHQVVESHIREEESPVSSISMHIPKSGRNIAHSRENDRCFSEKVHICRSIFVENPNGMIGKNH